MKVLGALMILLSGLCLGLQQSRKLAKREEALLDLKGLIRRFRTEMHYSTRPLNELISGDQDSRFCRIAANDPDFLLFPKEALKRSGERLFYETSDLELYHGFVKGLGESDVQGQIEHLALYENLLEAHLLQARENREKKSRLYVCFGLFGGITLCLLLW